MPPTRYLEIAEAPADELSGLSTGSQVPSENDVAGRVPVGRSAARAAIGELEQRGLVRRIQRAGTFVQRPLVLPQAASNSMGMPARHPGVRLSVQMSAYDQPMGRSALWAAGTDRSTVAVGLKRTRIAAPADGRQSGSVELPVGPGDAGVGGPEPAEELGIGMQRPYWKVDAVLEDPDKAITAWAGTEFRADRITLDLRIGDAAALPVR